MLAKILDNNTRQKYVDEEEQLWENEHLSRLSSLVYSCLYAS